jgi:hypothetical protein
VGLLYPKGEGGYRRTLAPKPSLDWVGVRSNVLCPALKVRTFCSFVTQLNIDPQLVSSTRGPPPPRIATAAGDRRRTRPRSAEIEGDLHCLDPPTLDPKQERRTAVCGALGQKSGPLIWSSYTPIRTAFVEGSGACVCRRGLLFGCLFVCVCVWRGGEGG